MSNSERPKALRGLKEGGGALKVQLQFVFHLLKDIFVIFPCRFKKRIYHYRFFFFARGLNQMEVVFESKASRPKHPSSFSVWAMADEAKAA